MALDLSNLSRCKRLRVGCVLVPPDMSEVAAIGYNGPPAGEDNDACRATAGGCGCIHAEANALVKVRSGPAGLVLVTTDSPCEHCAGLIINSGRVGWVVYTRHYRDSRGLDLLENRGIGVVRSLPWWDPFLEGKEKTPAEPWAGVVKEG